MLAKQAKTLSKRQITLTTALLQQTRYPTRNLAIFLLSVKAGLRAKEIASLTWDMLTDPEGTSRSSAASQRRSQQGFVWQGHPVEQGPQSSSCKHCRTRRGSSPYVITTERAERTSAAAIVNLFAHWYRAAGLQGCSSHSGRRTFITNAARTISTVGGSLRDVQMLAGHRALSTTQRYIEADVDAQKRVVDLV